MDRSFYKGENVAYSDINFTWSDFTSLDSLFFHALLASFYIWLEIYSQRSIIEEQSNSLWLVWLIPGFLMCYWAIRVWEKPLITFVEKHTDLIMVHESLSMIANLTYQDLLRFHMSSTGLTQPLQSSLSLPWKGHFSKFFFLFFMFWEEMHLKHLSYIPSLWLTKTKLLIHCYLTEL